jgi:dihydrofolate synthase/folylpolyglutamate synthase
VAHNPAAAEALAATLAADGHSGATLAIVGMLDDKDVEGCMQPLNEHVDQWIAVTANSHRAIPAQELARRIANACGRPCLVANSLGDAIELARRDASINDRILATGSFFLVGPVLERLYSRPQT